MSLVYIWLCSLQACNNNQPNTVKKERPSTKKGLDNAKYKWAAKACMCGVTADGNKILIIKSQAAKQKLTASVFWLRFHFFFINMSRICK